MKYAYGITSFEVGDINPADGTLLNPVDVTKGIYKDTIEVNEPEGTETEHYVEGSKDPIVSVDEAGKTTLSCSFADTSAANKLSFMGGDVVTLNTVDTWNSPSDNVVIEKYIKITTKDGTVLQYPRVKVRGRLTGNISEKGILLMLVKMTVLAPNFPALKSVMASDPATA